MQTNITYKWQIEVEYQVGIGCADDPNCSSPGTLPDLSAYWTFTTTIYSGVPQKPTNLTAVALSNGQSAGGQTCTKPECIFWDWDPAADAGWYEFQNNATDPITADYYMEEKLYCNQERIDNVRACNPNGCGPFTDNEITIYSNACPPANCWTGSISTTSIEWFWDPGGNPAGTKYYALATTSTAVPCTPPDQGPGCVVGESGETTANSWTLGGLECGTEYQMRVHAINGDGISSADTYCPAVSTAACPLPDLVVGAVTPPAAGQCGGADYSLSADIANNGGAGTGSFNVSFTVTDTASGASEQVCYLSVGSLGAGAVAALACSVDCAANPASPACTSGSKTVSVTADAAGAVAEEDETNNTADAAYTLDSAPLAVLNLRETSVTASAISWDWDPDPTATAPTAYDIYIDGVLDGVVTVSNYTKSGLERKALRPKGSAGK